MAAKEENALAWLDAWEDYDPPIRKPYNYEHGIRGVQLLLGEDAFSRTPDDPLFYVANVDEEELMGYIQRAGGMTSWSGPFEPFARGFIEALRQNLKALLRLVFPDTGLVLFLHCALHYGVLQYIVGQRDLVRDASPRMAARLKAARQKLIDA